MNAYNSGHLVAMNGFMILGVLLVAALVLGAIMLLIAWINDRWQRRPRLQVKLRVDVRPAVRGFRQAARSVDRLNQRRLP